jgi:glutamyl-tRNA synthetase
MVEKIVTRFAPSPTGFMHVGSARTASYAWLWAKKNKGQFILRIEDTDKEREVEGSIEHIKKSLKWLGLDWDQGPDVNGPHAPYIQSERLEIYKKYAEKLTKAGHTYLDGQAIKFKIPEKKRTNWRDIVWGELSAGPEALEDFVLIKSDGFPTYNFAHVVDDIEMRVTHVVRGQEFISSTPKFLSLYEALGVQPPQFVTTPPIMGPDGKKKLSKRDGAKDILEYEQEGYMPDAMLNYLAFLGFNPGGEQEVYTREELINIFDLKKIQHSGAQWNDQKLDWLNREHMKLLTPAEIEKNILKYLPENLREKKLVPVIWERISKWGDITKMAEKGELDFFIHPPVFSKDKLIFKNTSSEKISANLQKAIQDLEKIEEKDFTKENIKKTLMNIADSLDSRGELLHPVRFALSGQDQSPDPFIIAEILGKNETLSRLHKAV